MQLNGSRLYGTFRSRLDASMNRRFNDITDPNGSISRVSRVSRISRL